MKNLLGKLILIPLFVLILSLMTVTNASAATYNLFGKITKASGGNVSGATIDVLQANTTTVVQSASSNSMGNYTLNVEEGTYDIRVTPPSGQGLGISITEDFQISENSSLNFTLEYYEMCDPNGIRIHVSRMRTCCHRDFHV